ncbi:hypothetical protein RI367_002475 [Sorochytrium milnesiophthora]
MQLTNTIAIILAAVLVTVNGAAVPSVKTAIAFPKVTKDVRFAAPHIIAAGTVFDGGNARFQRSNVRCGDPHVNSLLNTTVFVLEAGATLRNAVIGPDQRKGVFCEGPCTVENVFWEHVCNSALTFKQSDGGARTVSGGGAQNAVDKVILHDGTGDVTIRNFAVANFGSMYSCTSGNCGAVTMCGITATNGTSIATQNKKETSDVVHIEKSTFHRVKQVCTSKDAAVCRVDSVSVKILKQ